MAKKILLIDDNSETRMLYESLLRDNGFTVTATGDALEGFRESIEGQFDLILLDLMMPKMDGLTILSELEKLGKEKKVMLVTNLAENAVVSKARKFDIKGVIMKSEVTPDKFIDQVTNAL